MDMYATGKNRLWIPFVWVVVALLPVMVLRDFTPSNELRYLSIADEALANSQVFAFTNHGEAYADKPPLYLWIVMAGRVLFGEHVMLFLSLFSLVPALVITFVMDRWTRGLIRDDFRIDAALMLLTCGLFMGMAIVLRMDMLMVMWIVLALYTFHNMMLGRGNLRRQQWLFPIYVFLGVFTKGPMGILIPLVTTLCYLLSRRELRRFGLCWGWRTWVVLVALCAGWFGGVMADGGTAYLDNLLVRQTVGRAVNSFHHKRPIWYYAVSMWYTLLPWTLLLIGVAVMAWTRRARFRTDTERLFLISAVSTFVLLSFISSKIQVYLLPAYPFLAYLGAIYMSRYPMSRWIAAALTLPAVVLACSAVALVYVASQEGTQYLGTPLFYTAAALLTATGLASLWLLWVSRRVNIAVRVMACGLLAAIFTAGFAVPSLNPRLGYEAVSRQALEMSQKTGCTRIVTYAMHRPDNIDVYLGRPFEMIARRDSARLDTLGRAVVITPARHAARFDAALIVATGDNVVLLHRPDTHKQPLQQ